VGCVMPFSVAGDIAAIGGRAFIATGIDADGHGVLVRFSLTNPWIPEPAARIDEVMSLGAGVDPLSVYWSANDSGLYLLDGIANLVLYAPYAGGAAALPACGTYVQAASLAASMRDNILLREPMGG